MAENSAVTSTLFLGSIWLLVATAMPVVSKVLELRAAPSESRAASEPEVELSPSGKRRDTVDLLGLVAPLIGSLTLVVGTWMERGLSAGLGAIGVAFALAAIALTMWFAPKASSRPRRLLVPLGVGTVAALAVLMLWR